MTIENRIITFIKNLQFIFKPKYWFMNYPYNKEVDKIINELLDKYDMSNNGSSEHTVKLGPAVIWIANRPYASGTLYLTPLDKLRPSRLTIKRLLNKYYEFIKGKSPTMSEEVRNLRKLYNLPIN